LIELSEIAIDNSFRKILIMRKTHKGIAKRFKVTGSGKVTHRKPGQRHLRRKKTNKQGQAGRQDHVLASGMAKRVINALSS